MSLRIVSAVKMEEVFMSTNYEFIRYEESDGIGILTLNRPDKLNALNSSVLTELKSCLEAINKENPFQIRGLIFTGEGEKSFIAGADIAEMQEMGKDEAYKFGWMGQNVTTLLEELSVPVIACVNGFALGGGCEMAMSCDFIYATENALFGQPEVKLGLIPGFGGTQRLAKYIGRSKAKEVIYSGRNIKIDEALASGLVLSTFKSKNEMINAAKEFINKLNNNSPVAIKLAKKAINSGVDLPTTDGLEVELGCFAEGFASEDMKEGTQAFIEKRKANFKGC